MTRNWNLCILPTHEGEATQVCNSTNPDELKTSHSLQTWRYNRTAMCIIMMTFRARNVSKFSLLPSNWKVGKLSVPFWTEHSTTLLYNRQAVMFLDYSHEPHSGKSTILQHRWKSLASLGYSQNCQITKRSKLSTRVTDANAFRLSRAMVRPWGHKNTLQKQQAAMSVSLTTNKSYFNATKPAPYPDTRHQLECTHVLDDA